MMCLINSKTMKNLIFILLGLLLLSSCLKNTEDAFAACPWEPTFVYQEHRHHMYFPLTLSPQQTTYQVGDTLRVSMIFSDSIYDGNYDRKFKIPNYPMRMATTLFKLEADTIKWGFDSNSLLLDSTFQSRILPGSDRIGTAVYGIPVHENDSYNYFFDIILTTPGTYVMQSRDDYMVASGRSEFYKEVLNIDFEGRCQGIGFSVHIRVQGDNQVWEFLDEFKAFNELSNNIWGSQVDSLNQAIGTNGRWLEAWGTYCFEVVE